jgi:SAM-dependent methyltransferase
MTKELINDIIQWDVKSWSRAIHYWESNINWNHIKNGLELGGRQGGLSLWLASKGIETVCSDLDNISNTAGSLHSRHNIQSLIRYENIDATSIPYENHFDVIVFKSILGGIGREESSVLQKKVIEQIHKALKPGGKLLFAENISASPMHRFLRKRFTEWNGYWKYFNLEDIQSFLRDYSNFKIHTSGFLATLGRNERQRNILATFDDLIFNRMCPKDWKYICYGIAEK